VNGQGEFAECVGGFVVQGTAFELALHPAKAFAQGDILIDIAEFAKQAFYFLYTFNGGANRSLGFGIFCLPSLDAF